MKKKIKVCLISSIQFGYENFISHVAKELNNNYDLTAVFKWNNINKSPVHKGIKFHNISFRRTVSPVSMFKTIIELYIYFKKEKFDIIQVTTPIASISSRLALLFIKKKVIIYKVHGYYFHEYMSLYKRFFHIFLEFFLAKITDYIFCVSSEDTIFSKTLGFKKSSEIFYTGNGINHLNYNPPNDFEKISYRSEYGLSKESLVIGFVGRLVEDKGIRELLQSFESLLLNHNNIQLLICGSRLRSDHGVNVDEYIKSFQKKNPGKLVCTGHLNETQKIYKAIDIFCLPSWREGLPMTVLEAMMTGLPVVASNVRGSREAILNNMNGFLIEPRNVTDLSEKLNTLIIDKDLRLKMGKKGLLIAHQRFKEKEVVKNEVKLFEKIVREKLL